ncbi:MAG TPA: hypothetical protein VI612_05300 [Candidatus Nanoarchaeia archaeon]|nr:hypothetical protein [Candidatus Nanoarchaeia archaeon]
MSNENYKPIKGQTAKAEDLSLLVEQLSEKGKRLAILLAAERGIPIDPKYHPIVREKIKEIEESDMPGRVWDAGRLARNIGDLDGVIQILRRAGKSSHARAGLCPFIFGLYLAKGDTAEALRFYEAEKVSNPKDTLSINSDFGRVAAREGYLEIAIKLCRNEWLMRHNVVFWLEQLGDIDEAIQVWQDDCNHVEGAELAIKYEKKDKARELYLLAIKEAFRKKDWDPEYLDQVFKLCEGIGDEKIVLPVYKRIAAEYERGEHLFLSNAAELYAKLGNHHKTTELWKKYVARCDQKGAFLNAAEGCEKLGDSERAKFYKRLSELLSKHD